MGQMTFNFETEEKKPEKKQDVEIKEEKKIENKEEANPKSNEIIEKKVKSKSVKNKKNKKTKAHQMAKEQRDIPVSEFLNKIDIF